MRNINEINMNDIIKGYVEFALNMYREGSEEGEAIGMAAYCLEDEFDTICKTDDIYDEFFKNVRKEMPWYSFYDRRVYYDQGNGLDREEMIEIIHNEKSVWRR